MGGARIWIQAARPKTLGAAVAPVAIGTAMAAKDGAFHLGAALAALAGALLIQVGTNYANDYFDFVKGADDHKTRLGPTRAVAAGQVSPAAMRNAFVLVFLLAIAVGAYLLARAGWPVAVIGLLGVALGVLYTGGPAPLAYVGLGDIAVLIYFGPVAVAGTYYVQALQWSEASIVAGLAPGLLATALLAINNLRDVDEDRAANKRTLAVRFGRRFAKAQIYVCVIGALVVYVVVSSSLGAGRALALIPFAISGLALTKIARSKPGDRLTGELGMMGLVLVLYAVLFVVAWLQ